MRLNELVVVIFFFFLLVASPRRASQRFVRSFALQLSRFFSFSLLPTQQPRETQLGAETQRLGKEAATAVIYVHRSGLCVATQFAATVFWSSMACLLAHWLAGWLSELKK